MRTIVIGQVRTQDTSVHFSLKRWWKDWVPYHRRTSFPLPIQSSLFWAKMTLFLAHHMSTQMHCWRFAADTKQFQNISCSTLCLPVCKLPYLNAVTWINDIEVTVIYNKTGIVIGVWKQRHYSKSKGIFYTTWKNITK